MLGTRWKIKPPLGYEIDWQHPLAQGLQFFAPLWEGSGPVTYDLVTGTALSMNASPTWSGAGSSPGLLCNTSNASVAALAPPSLQFGWPSSLAIGFRPIANPSVTNAILFGTSHYNGGNGPPYFGMAFQYNSSNTAIALEANFGGALGTVGSATVATGVDAVVSASITSGSQILYGGSLPTYAGARVGTGSSSGANTYSTNPYVFIGNASLFSGRNPNVIAYWAAMWSRVLQPAEHAALAANIWQIFQPKRTPTAAILYSYAWPTTFQATPGSVPSTHPGHITVQLAGSYTNWTGGTTFTVSGVAGTTLVGQSVIDRRTATVTIATGASTGRLTISDGAVPTTIQVLAPALGCTTTGSIAGGTYAVTLAGTNTTWLSETPSTLFSISGVSGTSISSVTVRSNTLATAAIAVGNSTGTNVVTDTSTGATATIAAMAPPVGSLQLTGPLLLGSPSSSALFGSKASATIAFKIQIDADTVPVGSLASGTTLVGWGSNVSGGVGLAVYYPATNTLTITAYGASGKSQTLTWSTTVQLGTGYHFVISWAGGAQVIYQDGVPVASSAFAANTYAYQQVQIGSGAAVAVNHQVSNLMIWSGYAASQADAVALMNGTVTPFQIGGGASAWWPLSGGIAGAHPAISDVWMADATGNGNALTIVSGSLANARYAGAIAVQAPVRVAPHVTKCGRLAMFGSIAAVPAANGVYPHQPITAVNGTPTVYRNGSAVQLGLARWFNQLLDSPFVAYLLQCGSVNRIAIQSGGTGYTGIPSASWSGGGGSGLVLGTPTTASGVTNYAVTAAGSGYSTGPTVTITDPGGSGTGAVAYAIVIKGMIVGYWISNGGSNYSNPTVVVSGGGSGATAVATQSGGVITAVNGVACGSGYHNPPAVTVAAPSGSSGATGNITAQAIAVVSPTGTVAAVLPLCAGLLGSGSGYSSGSPPTVAIAAPASGTTATAGATVSSYVESIPVILPGNGFTGLPTITISGGSGSGAVALPIMTGVAASDTITYSAPIGWFMTALGGPAPATNAAVANWTGQLEGPTNGMVGFQAMPTMLLGASVGDQPASAGSSNFTAANRSLQGQPWAAVGSGVLTTGSNGFPISWTNPSATYVQQFGYKPNAGNGLDAMGVPNQTGQWTLQYDDPHVNTASASAAWLSAHFFSYVTVKPISLSGNSNAAAGTVTISGGAITGIAVASGGAGYQGAIAVITGGGSGSGAVVTVQCSGGAVTGFRVVNGGTNYSGTPTVTIYGTRVAGTAVTAVFDFEYTANPTAWALGVSLNVANAAGSWTISNPWVVSPVAATGLAATVDRTNPLAVDGNVLAALAVGGKAPAALRFMDATAGYGGVANYIDASDLAFGPQVGAASWAVGTTLGVSFAYARFINTNPANNTYAWSSTKVYGNQPWAVSGTDAPFTVTGKLTSGSAVVTAVSSTASIIAGATIAGTGIPGGTSVAMLGILIRGNLTSGSAVVTGIASTTSLASGMIVAGSFIPGGATISSVDSASQITLSKNATYTTPGNLQVGAASLVTLSQPATASASGETLTITNPSYVSLSAADNGSFILSENGAQAWSVLELRSIQPHGLKSGQYVAISGDSIPIPLTNGQSLGAQYSSGVTAWVTGPSTIAVAIYCGGNAPSSTSPQTVYSTSEISLVTANYPSGWACTMPVPCNSSCVPYEYAAAMCQQVGCDLWLNIPHAATDSLVRAIAAKVMANIGATAKVYLEFGNENWNSSFPSNGYHRSLSILMGYVTPGTSTFDGHLIAYGQPLSNGPYGSVPLTTSHAFDVFAAAWTGAGLSASRLRRSYGSNYSSPGTTQQLAESLQQYNITAVDYVHVAPYMTLATDFSIASAMAPAGATVSNAGSWPADAINDIYRYWMAYSQSVWGLWKGHAQYCQGLGQPLFAATINTTGGGSTGGSLSAGTYYIGYTFVDSVGRETTLGFSETSFAISSGNIPTMAMPAWPVWTQSMNVYLTQAGGASGAEVFYMTIPRSSYGYGHTYPIGTGIPLSGANTGTAQPPTVNLAAANAPQFPSTVCYEGSLQVCPATNSPLQVELSHDRFLHASSADAHTGFWVMCQQGCPTFSGSGAALMVYFQLFNQPSYPNMWTMAMSTQQLPGTGSGNTFATIQGGAPADGHAHYQADTSPALLAFQNWFVVSSPNPPTTSTGGRRWFSGLRKPVMQLGR